MHLNACIILLIHPLLVANAMYVATTITRTLGVGGQFKPNFYVN